MLQILSYIGGLQIFTNPRAKVKLELSYGFFTKISKKDWDSIFNFPPNKRQLQKLVKEGRVQVYKKVGDRQERITLQELLESELPNGVNPLVAPSETAKTSKKSKTKSSTPVFNSELDNGSESS